MLAQSPLNTHQLDLVTQALTPVYCQAIAGSPVDTIHPYAISVFNLHPTPALVKPPDASADLLLRTMNVRRITGIGREQLSPLSGEHFLHYRGECLTRADLTAVVAGRLWAVAPLHITEILKPPVDADCFGAHRLVVYTASGATWDLGIVVLAEQSDRVAQHMADITAANLHFELFPPGTTRPQHMQDTSYVFPRTGHRLADL